MIALWLFPESDFEAWRALVANPVCGTYAEYLTLLAAIQADLERQGHDVRSVKMTVAAMRAGLAAHGLDNTPDNFARVRAGRPSGLSLADFSKQLFNRFVHVSRRPMLI